MHIDINIKSFFKKTSQSANEIAWCSDRVFVKFLVQDIKFEINVTLTLTGLDATIM